MSDFVMPSLGADMESGRVVEWLVAPGDRVSSGDVIVVIETDKGAIDVEIFEDGVIDELVAPLDVELPVGAVLATLRGAGEARAVEPAAAPRAPAPRPPSPTPVEVSAPRRAPAGSRVRASPLARRRAEALRIDLGSVAGSGPQGAITAADVEAAAGAARPERRRGFDAAAMRRAIGAAMSRAKREIPHYYLSQPVCVDAALAWLEARNAVLAVERRMLPAALLLRASALALARRPKFNGRFEDGAFVPAAQVHLGWAVALRGGGLIAPAIRDADSRSVEDLMAALRDLVKRARGGGLRGSELTDATATVTSLGDRGAEAVWPVIYPPQVAMIGFGRIAPRPWVVDGGVAARSVVTVSLAADHRVSDGHEGSLLLEEIAGALAEPEQL